MSESTNTSWTVKDGGMMLIVIQFQFVFNEIVWTGGAEGGKAGGSVGGGGVEAEVWAEGV